MGTHKVIEGRTVTTLRGVVAGGAHVSARDFSRGDTAISELENAKVIALIPVKKKPEPK